MFSHLKIILNVQWSRRARNLFLCQYIYNWRYCIIKLNFINVVVAVAKSHTLPVEENSKYFWMFFAYFVLMFRQHLKWRFSALQCVKIKNLSRVLMRFIPLLKWLSVSCQKGKAIYVSGTSPLYKVSKSLRAKRNHNFKIEWVIRDFDWMHGFRQQVYTQNFFNVICVVNSENLPIFIFHLNIH